MQLSLGHARRNGARSQFRSGPDLTVGENHAIDRLAACTRLTFQRDAIVASLQPQDYVGPAMGHDYVAWGDASGDLKDVVRPRPGGALDDGVAPITAPEEIGCVADPARKPVIARPAVKRECQVEA